MRSERTISLAPTICQTARNSTTDSSPTTRRAERRASNAFSERPSAMSEPEVSATMSVRVRGFGFLPRTRRLHLLFQQIPDALAIGGEFRLVADLERPRPRQRDANVLDHAPRRGAHHDDAVGEID